MSGPRRSIMYGPAYSLPFCLVHSKPFLQHLASSLQLFYTLCLLFLGLPLFLPLFLSAVLAWTILCHSSELLCHSIKLSSLQYVCKRFLCQFLFSDAYCSYCVRFFKFLILSNFVFPIIFVRHFISPDLLHSVLSCNPTFSFIYAGHDCILRLCVCVWDTV